MACNCLTYTCLDVIQQYNNCPEFLTLRLVAPATGTYSWQYEFNGMWKGGTIDTTISENIVLPYVFNERYVHTIKFYDTDGTLLNDTCYKLDTSQIAGTYTTPVVGESNYLNVTITAGMLSLNDEQQQVVTIEAIDGRTIIFVADGNQLYNVASFTQDGNAFTLINGAVFYVGQVITLLFG